LAGTFPDAEARPEVSGQAFMTAREVSRRRTRWKAAPTARRLTAAART